mmetsp:Transcript_20786/g.58537  ORF Transcript_20786/g.58537 Transcript_20786/m.58537 type:complete len:210 (+) Transcript_20786:394-1023(+)
MKKPAQSARRSSSASPRPPPGARPARESCSRSWPRMSRAWRRARWCSACSRQNSGLWPERSQASKAPRSVRWSPSGFWSRRFAASATRASGASRLAGRYQMPSALSTATSVSAASRQPRPPAARRQRAYWGSTGSCAMRRPSSVITPSWSSAPSRKSVRRDRTRRTRSGGSRKSKLTTSWMPMAFICSVTEARLLRRISGTVTLGRLRR